MSMRSTVVHSHTPWKLKPPVPRLGQGRPFQLRVAPSVPPRTGTSVGGQTGLFDGLAGVLHQMEVGLDLFQHVAVAVLDLYLHGAGAVFAVEVIGNVEEVILLVLQLVGIVVAQDVAQLGVGHVAVHLAQVVEALTALGGLGTGP